MVMDMLTTRRTFLFGVTKAVAVAAFLPVIGGVGPLMAAKEFEAVPGSAMFHGIWKGPTLVSLMTDLFEATGMRSDEFDVGMLASPALAGMFVPGPYRMQVRSRKVNGTVRIRGADVWGRFAGTPPKRDEVVRVWLPHDDGHATVGDFAFESIPYDHSEVEKMPATTRRPVVLGGSFMETPPSRRQRALSTKRGNPTVVLG